MMARGRAAGPSGEGVNKKLMNKRLRRVQGERGHKHRGCGVGRGCKAAVDNRGHWPHGLRGFLAAVLVSAAATGSALAQTVSGTIAEAVDFFTFPDSDQMMGQGVLFRLRMGDSTALALSFPQELTFSYRFNLYRTLADLSQPIPVGVSVEEVASEQFIIDGGSVLDFQFAPQPGENLTLVLKCQMCDPADGFAFDLIGAELLTFGPEPDAAVELASLVAASSGMDRLVVLDAQRVVRDMGAVSLAARRTARLATLSTKSDGTAPAALVGNVHSWAQLTGFDTSADLGPGGMTGTGFQVGADIGMGPDRVAGLSLGHASMTATDGATGQSGGLTYLQPYVAWDPGPWHGHASLIYGRGTYDQTSTSGFGTGKTSLFALTLEGGFDRVVAPGLTLTPTLGLIRGQQTVTGTAGTLADAGTRRVDFAQTSLGARLTYQRPAGEVFAGLHADYLSQDTGAVLTDGFLSEDGWTGRIEVGGSYQLGTGLGLATTVDLGGIGGAAQTLSGALQLSWQF
jgi:hypothetical protein